ncbi:MAG TPA: hypothetical protein PL188_02620 [Candidatus Cloacimonadota bacterium]|nr:hypothetical protein [Candidatus Cloacimonadota bacterium]
MKKALKTILTLGGVAFAGYYAYKQYRKFSQSEEMNKTLHAFLKKIYGEEPVLKIHKALDTIMIKAGFSQEVRDKFGDIENAIRDYVQKYYPALVAKLHIKVTDRETAEEAVEEDE